MMWFLKHGTYFEFLNGSPEDLCYVPLREAVALSGDLALWRRAQRFLPEGEAAWSAGDHFHEARVVVFFFLFFI